MSNPHQNAGDSYFGAIREKRPGVLVFLAGFVTTAATCLLEYMLEQNDINVVGWYIWGLVPVGALLVGFAAGSGYLLLAWFSGVKFSPGVFVLIGLIQMAGYACAQYLTFVEWKEANPGIALGFVDYYDLTTRTIAFERHGKAGDALGVLGYGVRALEVAGFVAGGVFAPLLLFGSPYCAECQLYKRTKTVAYIRVGSQLKKVEKKTEDQGADQSEPAETYTGVAGKIVEQMLASVQSGNAIELARLVKEHGVKAGKAAKSPTHLEVRRECCPSCKAGDLVFTVVTGKTSSNKSGVRSEIGRATQSGKFWSQFFA